MKKPIGLASSIIAVFLSMPMIAGQQAFPVVSTVDEPTIAGRQVALDSEGKLLPWPIPENTGYSYSAYFLSQWTIVLDQYNRQRLPYYYCCFDFDRTTFELIPDPSWVNSTGYLRAMMEGFMERLYPYTGDPRTLEFLENFVDYELENGLTPEGYAWAQVPYPSANPGSKRYTGWSQHGEDFVEPHVVGEDGYAYLRLYEMTGNTRYLRAAIRCANALVKNFKPGDENHSPWPYRCHARDGSLQDGKGMFPYSANVVEPIMLLDELVRLDQGDVSSFKKVRAGAWSWLMKYPMHNNVWVGYFEDVQGSMDNMNQVIPLEFARYILLHPEKDSEWREHARQLIDWVKTTPKWPKYLVHGAMVTTEQGSGKEFCCNLPNQCCDSHSSRLAAVEALYYARTGDVAYKQAAYRTYNWVTYFQGLPAAAHAPFSNQWWFTDEFADGPRRMMDAFWAVPEWAPADESHLLGSISVVTKIQYSAGRVTYSTFDADSTDVLRLNFIPDFISVGGRIISRHSDLQHEGYVFDDKSRTLSIRHTSSRDVDIQGKSDQAPSSLITFDDPHLSAGTRLLGQYPSGVIDWGDGEWAIGTPYGKFGTFTLALSDPNATRGEFNFYSPRIFAGVDVYNDGDKEATLTVHSLGSREISCKIKSKELLHFRTGWRDPSSKVIFEFTNGHALRFDNLAYIHP
ncbi:glycoside hydrolase family protein [Terracidiphilus gabretensis]|uniref:hypothetical protein n=1 Tax=Terracidiphilus gabretensis TaxID=1577687 RepID=UPI001E6018B2|nr:hypothetical protein [Terracidiphilus gabretensis]